MPPESSFGLSVTQPAIYYGEGMPGSRIVATGVKEFDYPKGNENIYTSYSGEGGIPIDIYRQDGSCSPGPKRTSIFCSPHYLKPDSRIQIWRDVQERVARVAPFLSSTQSLIPS